MSHKESENSEYPKSAADKHKSELYGLLLSAAWAGLPPSRKMLLDNLDREAIKK